MVLSVPRDRWLGEYPRWFDWVLEHAEIYDYGRYPVKGMGVWRPYGFQIRRRVLELIRDLHDSRGHEEVLFPLLIPYHLLARESEHIKGFEDEVYWVTHGGLEELDVKLALRPTSETSITFLETYWIQSYKQLPKKYYQIVSIFRYETKATRPMIRLREVTTFKEAHTVHDSFEDAERQVLEAIEIYKEIYDRLGIPFIISRRPEWDKFAGALYTIAFDTVMPDGRALQIGTVHNLGQSFTRAFNFKIQLADETHDHPWQTSYGISDRIIATVISIHGDDRGTVLVPEIAPIQIVIVPIPSGEEEERRRVEREAVRLAEELREAGFRVRVDDREELRPGAKFYYWEARGVPVRIELGPREVEEGFVTVARRDTLEKITIPRGELIDSMRRLMNEIYENLKERAWRFLRERILRTDNLESAREWIAERRGVVELPWCGGDECAAELEKELDAKSLGTPWPREEADGYRCPVCGRESITWMRYSKTY
ncbi:MAG: proline--tRNA ligase [Desulfurococcales archaeon]|nr:proline--tRNA ligase [Desulfurococcales archaeon]